MYTTGSHEVVVRTMTKGETADGVRRGVTRGWHRHTFNARSSSRRPSFSAASSSPTTTDRSGSLWTALWDALRKCALAPMDPLIPLPGSRGAAETLAAARARLQRLPPAQAYEELLARAGGAPTFLVDIRSEAECARSGCIAGSLIIDHNVLEWRFDPRSEERLLIVDRCDLRVIVFCEDGTASSLATVALLDLGLLNATDIVGGFHAWQKAGLPVDMDLDVGTEPSHPTPSASLLSTCNPRR
ncbi:hypothetical protein B0H14DRAFT_3438053 [Mycena olivaceomarginata]|nr:hypothetical protein B0H14DRAFT_3438053 [Mycena olivaceomarginata]